MNLRFLALGRRSLNKKNDAKASPTRQRGKSGQGATRKAVKTTKTAEDKPDLSIWLNRSLVLFGAAVVLFAATKTYRWIESMPVEHIVVTGELEHVQKRAVQDLVQQSLSGGFLHTDLQAMRERMQGLPWVFEANVRRQWPSTLQIHVVEQLPIARWGEDAFLNHQGGLFHPSNQDEWESLPLLDGPEGAAPALMAKYLRLIDILGPVGLSVQALTLDARGEIEAVLDRDIRLVLGNEDFLERIHRFVTVYKKALASRLDEIERIDMRYETGLAVAFRDDDSQVAGL